MRKIFKSAFIIFFTLSIVLYSDKMSSAALEGLNLWMNTIVPSLFPFMVISSWLTFGFSEKPAFFDKVAFSLFGVPFRFMVLFPISILSGYPVGAKIISDLYVKKAISKDTAEHLLAFCNNPGAVFIISAVASSMLADRGAAVFLIFICVFSSLATGVLFNFVFPAERYSEGNINTASDTAIYTAISSAVGSILLVGGCIIFFSVIAETISLFLSSQNPIVDTVISGLLEFTQGIKKASALTPKLGYPIICAILCWGGLSVHLQTAAIIGNCGIDIKKYITGKAFCSATAYISAVLFYNLFFPEGKSMEVFYEISDSPSVFAASSFLAAAVFLLIGEKKCRK